MKTVTGEVESCKSISLSKAARILSKFAFSDNGACPAFTAYLKRASASFDELDQLHKEYKEYKSSGSQRKVKKKHFHDLVTEGIAKSVENHRNGGLVAMEIGGIGTGKGKESRGVNTSEGELGRVDVSLDVDQEMRHKSKNKRDERYGNDDAVNKSDSKTYTGSVDGSKETKKKKKKKKKRDQYEKGKHDVDEDIEKQVQSGHYSENDHDGQAVETGKNYGDKQKKSKKDKHNGDLAAVNVFEVKNEIESLDGSKEMKKEKKKRDKLGKDKSDDPVDFGKEMQNRPSSQDVVDREAAQIVENDGDEQRKHKKNKKKIKVKEENIGSGIEADEERDEITGAYQNIGNVEKGGEERKGKKKRSHGGKERENEGNLEIEAAYNRTNRKRKHETVADDGLDGSPEESKSKKKKR